PNFQQITDGHFVGTGIHLESLTGDQILAYTGTAASPTFIGGIHTGGSTYDAVFANNGQSSQLPSGLTDGVNTLSFGNGANHFVSGIYVGSTTGDQAALLAKINNEANWQGSASAQSLPTGPFGAGGSTAPEIDVQYQVGAVAVPDGDTT